MKILEKSRLRQISGGANWCGHQSCIGDTCSGKQCPAQMCVTDIVYCTPYNCTDATPCDMCMPNIIIH